MPSDFDDAVNTSWLEALDITTGRIYFVHLESKDGELVRPTGKTSWDAAGALTAADCRERSCCEQTFTKFGFGVAYSYGDEL